MNNIREQVYQYVLVEHEHQKTHIVHAGYVMACTLSQAYNIIGGEIPEALQGAELEIYCKPLLDQLCITQEDCHSIIDHEKISITSSISTKFVVPEQVEQMPNRIFLSQLLSRGADL